MAEIKYEIVGSSNFLRAAEYGSYLYNALMALEDKFLLAEKVMIYFEESLNPDPNKPVLNKLTVSDDGKTIKLIYKTARFFQKKNQMSRPALATFLGN